MACTIESLSHPTHTNERCSGTHAEREHAETSVTRQETRNRRRHKSRPTLVTRRKTTGLARLGPISSIFAQGHKAAAELCQDSSFHTHNSPGITFSPSFWMTHVVTQRHLYRGGFALHRLDPQRSPSQFPPVREMDETPSSTTRGRTRSVRLQT